MNSREYFEKIDKLTQELKLRTAIRTLEEMIQKYPAQSQFFYFQLGGLYRSFIGNGAAAKDHLLRSIESKNVGLIEESTADEIEAYSLENLMLLSLSFDEYYSFADRLAKIQPENTMINTDRPKFIEKMEGQGYSWSMVMEWRASNYYNFEQIQNDPGLYAEAISTYHLMFENRRFLRISEENYGMLIISASVVALNLFSKYGMTMEQKQGKVEPSEFLMVVTNILPYVKDFVKKNPSEEKAAEMLQELEQVLQLAKEVIGIPYADRIVGETICHNTIALLTKNRDELYQIIDELSAALLVPFPESPTREEYDKRVEQEKESIRQCQDRYGTDKINFQIDPMKTDTNFSCLVGPKRIVPKAWVYYTLAMMYLVGVKDFNSAFPLFEKALLVSPNYFYALYGIAACYAKIGNYNKAIYYYEKALELKPDDTDTIEELDMAKKEEKKNL